ncbi:MAG TPA: hypothetical protein VK764_10390, partial [Terracidiphilus sp.]|nr:hypothetical protein [Terracidiphilus sp.]
ALLADRPSLKINLEMIMSLDKTSGARMPLSGEAIRMMNYVDDVAVTLRRILALVPTLTPEERQRVSEYLSQSKPAVETVQTALLSK